MANDLPPDPPSGPGDPLLVERLAHGPHPGVAHGDIDGDAGVAHAQAGVAVRGDVVLRAAQPADEEEGKAILTGTLDAPLGVAGVEAREGGLVAGHARVEALDDAAHDGLAAEEGKGGRGGFNHAPRVLAHSPRDGRGRRARAPISSRRTTSVGRASPLPAVNSRSACGAILARSPAWASGQGLLGAEETTGRDARAREGRLEARLVLLRFLP